MYVNVKPLINEISVAWDVHAASDKLFADFKIKHVVFTEKNNFPKWCKMRYVLTKIDKNPNFTLH